MPLLHPLDLPRQRLEERRRAARSSSAGRTRSAPSRRPAWRAERRAAAFARRSPTAARRARRRRACAAASACTCAWWSMAQASRGAPVREARQDTSASKRSPRKPSRASEAGSLTSPTRTVAPGSSRALSSRRRARRRRRRAGARNTPPRDRAAPARARWRGRSCRWRRARRRVAGARSEVGSRRVCGWRRDLSDPAREVPLPASATRQMDAQVPCAHSADRAVPLRAQLPERAAACVGPFQIHRRREGGLISHFAVAAVGHTLLDPAFRSTRNLGVDPCGGTGTEPTAALE